MTLTITWCWWQIWLLSTICSIFNIGHQHTVCNIPKMSTWSILYYRYRTAILELCHQNFVVNKNKCIHFYKKKMFLNFATNQNDVKLTDKNRSSILAVDLVILRSDRRFSRHFQILLRFRATDFRFIVLSSYSSSVSDESLDGDFRGL